MQCVRVALVRDGSLAVGGCWWLRGWMVRILLALRALHIGPGSAPVWCCWGCGGFGAVVYVVLWAFGWLCLDDGVVVVAVVGWSLVFCRPVYFCATRVSSSSVVACVSSWAAVSSFWDVLVSSASSALRVLTGSLRTLRRRPLCRSARDSLASCPCVPPRQGSPPCPAARFPSSGCTLGARPRVSRHPSCGTVCVW